MSEDGNTRPRRLARFTTRSINLGSAPEAITHKATRRVAGFRARNPLFRALRAAQRGFKRVRAAQSIAGAAHRGVRALESRGARPRARPDQAPRRAPG